MVVLYGLTNQIAAWQTLSPAQIAAELRNMGCDGVFLKHLDLGNPGGSTPTLSASGTDAILPPRYLRRNVLTWIDALHTAGLQVYLSHGIFIDHHINHHINHHGDNLWQRWPDSRPVTATGAPAPQEDWYRPLRPTHTGVRALRLQQLGQLVADLPIDGVWLDFIRWPARWEKQSLSLYDSSFDEETLALFAEECTIDLPTAPVAVRNRWILAEKQQTWIDWRCRVIERFVEDAIAIVRRRLPDARIGLFTVPWTGDPLVDRSNVAAANHRIVGQDLTRLGRHVDVISPMVYHHLCGRPVEWIETISRYAGSKSQASIWPVIEAIDPPAHYPAAEFSAALSAAQKAGSQNLIIFKLDGLLADPEKQSVLTIKNRSPRGKG